METAHVSVSWPFVSGPGRVGEKSGDRVGR